MRAIGSPRLPVAGLSSPEKSCGRPLLQTDSSRTSLPHPTGREEDTDPTSAKMSLARLHDKHKLRKYWEEKIETHCDMMGNEETRLRNSALSRLREEWLRRLKLRSQQLENFEEERMRTAKMATE
ncbi:hypothetical protein DPEC_G00333790 [Dallia pectoralis]|uniref:Uncharacterized protein n=1 Tax=Dallia pectoralis TaxID=75939 RepID=A0ACC2F6P2_DALPE|nr:hypothetical protein DPEC_G00333790 [Dallia pectoralis]